MIKYKLVIFKDSKKKKIILKKKMEREIESVGVMDTKYTLIKGLGTGGTSLVYLGLLPDTNPPQQVAVKILKANDERNAFDFEKILKAEFETLKILNYENILKVYKLGKGNLVLDDKILENLNYMVLEYAEKVELLNYVRTWGRVGFNEYVARSLFRHILNGVNAIHKAGFCHRDIKLENIMLNKDYQIKICDFGFATELIGKNHDHLLTTTYGTPGYKAPEIYLRNPYQGDKVDVFALGVSIFGLLTAKVPFEEAKRSKLLYRLIIAKKWTQYWQKVNRYFPNGVSEEFKLLFQKMVAAIPSERPSIDEILNDPWFGLPSATPEELENELKFRERTVHPSEVFTNDTVKELNANIVYKGDDGNEEFFTESQTVYDGQKMLMNNDSIKITGKVIPHEFFSKLIGLIKSNGGNITCSDKKLKCEILFEEEEEEGDNEKEDEEEANYLQINARFNKINDDLHFITFQHISGNMFQFKEKVAEFQRLANEL